MNDQLRADPRTAWATHIYQQVDTFPVISTQVADWVLDWLGAEHVEVFTRGINGHRRPVKWRKVSAGRKPTGLVVRTLTRSLLLNDDLTGCQWPSGSWDEIGRHDNYLWGNADTSLAYRVDQGSFVQAFTPIDVISTCLRWGAGEHILRLPERPDVPTIPDLDHASNDATAVPVHTRILTGWSSVEELAEEHLRSLGIYDARRTPPGADAGLDVVSPNVVAQVKHTAQPVGRPVLQGLIGATGPGQRPVCYATAGYTANALAYAADRRIALYQVGELGEVTPLNPSARDLELDFGPQGTVWRAARAYAMDASIRAMSAFLSLHADYEGTVFNDRASSYRLRADAMLREPPTTFTTPLDLALHYHHAELLMATWAAHNFGHYPANAELPPDYQDPPAATDGPPGLSDFY